MKKMVVVSMMSVLAFNCIGAERDGWKLHQAEKLESFCSLHETVSTDDVYKLVFVPRPLFVQLCVQASQETKIQSQPFQELLYKIKAGIIDKNAAVIAITEKDAYHRLLSYIHVDSFGTVINNKKIGLGFCWSQVNDRRQRTNMCTCSTLNTGAQTQWWQNNESCMEFYRRHERSASYNFEANSSEYAVTVARFEGLIASLNDPTQYY